MHGNYFRCVWAFCASKRRVNYATDCKHFEGLTLVIQFSMNTSHERRSCPRGHVMWAAVPHFLHSSQTKDRITIHICISRNVNSFENIENAAMCYDWTTNQYRQREISRTQKVLSNPFNRRTTKRNDDRKKTCFHFFQLKDCTQTIKWFIQNHQSICCQLAHKRSFGSPFATYFACENSMASQMLLMITSRTKSTHQFTGSNCKLLFMAMKTHR